MREYKELLDVVSKMDVGTQKRGVTYVKMDVVSGEPLEAKPRSYSQLLGEVSSADTYAQMSGKQQRRQQFQTAQKQVQMQRQQEFPDSQSLKQDQNAAAPASKWQMPSLPKPQPKPEAQKWSIPSFPDIKIPSSQPIAPSAPSKPAPKQQPAGPKWSMPSFKMPQMQKPAPSVAPVKQNIQAPPVAMPPVAPMPRPEPLEQSAATELAKVVKASEITAPPIQQQAAIKPASNLVLPNLSVTDQVVELDKIIQNLKNSSFSADQMQIVKEEVVGLSKSVSSESKPSSPSVGIEKDMAELRQARLAEALSLIRGI